MLGSAPALGLVVSLVLVVGSISQVHGEQTALEEQALITGQQLHRDRVDTATAERLTAGAETYAGARRAEALDTALAALESAGAVVTVAAEVVDPETITPLDDALAELAALLAAAAPGAALPADPADGGTVPAPIDVAAASLASVLAEPGSVEEPAADSISTPATRPAASTPLAADIPTPEVPGSAAASLDLDVSARLVEVAAQVAELTEQVQAATDAANAEIAAAAQAAADELAAQQAAIERAAAELARKIAAADAAPNGAIPHKVLCGVTFDTRVLLRCDAAAALEQLNVAYRVKFGRNLEVVSSYRDYPAQVVTKEARGSLAAEPGTSNHGRGLAVDFAGFGGLGQFDRPTYLWMKAHSERFGWKHPPYMGPGGSGPLEPWHWEYGTH